jgi:hypothetical protein
MSNRKALRPGRLTAVTAGVAILTLGLTRCSDTTGSGERVLIGADITVGNGTAHTEVRVTRNGEPLSMAVVLTEAGLTGLPATMPFTEFVLPLPAEPNGTLIKHVTLDWHPGGHNPPGVFNVPHFDTHYYMITPPQRDAISPADPQFAAKSLLKPAADLIPAAYAGDPFAIPRMGVHYTDPNAPERKGQGLSTTFIYGFYNGEMIFLEPMASKSFLDTKASVVADLALPARYQVPGFYPTKHGVAYDAAKKQYRFELLNFVSR